MNRLFRLMSWGAGPFLSPFQWLFRMSITQVAAVAMLVAGWAWYEYGSLPFAGSTTKAPVAVALKEAVADAASEVPGSLQPPRRSPQPTLVLPLVGDRPSDDGQLLVTGAICNALARDGAYAPIEESKVDRALEKLFDLVGIAREPVTDRATAMRLAKAARAEVVMIGNVDRIQKIDDQKYAVAFDVQVFAEGEDKPLLVAGFPRVSEQPSRIWQWWPLLAVAAFTLLWPPIASPIMMRILKMENNFATAMTLLILTAVPAVIAWPLVFGAATGVWRIVAYAVGILLGGLWCTAVMSWVAERRS